MVLQSKDTRSGLETKKGIFLSLWPLAKKKKYDGLVFVLVFFFCQGNMLNQLNTKLQTRFPALCKLDWTWSKCSLGCEQLELQLVRVPCRWECGPSAVPCGHLQDGNTLLPSAVAVVKGTQNKALPSCCYLVSHTLL